MQLSKLMIAVFTMLITTPGCSARHRKATPSPAPPVTTTTSASSPRPKPSGANTTTAMDTSTAAHGLQLTGYFSQAGSDEGYLVKNIVTSGSATKLSVLNYAFANVVNNKCDVTSGDPGGDYKRVFDASISVDGIADDPTQPLKGNFNQLRKLKAMYPELKVVISLGRSMGPGGFHSAILSENRQAFVRSCVDAYIHGNFPEGDGIAAGVFDGIDIDFEYPNADEKEDFSATVAEFRRQLDAVRPGLLLTAAVGSAIEKIHNYDIPSLAENLDRINVMTYDLRGTWNRITGLHSPIYLWPGEPTQDPTYTSDYAIQVWKKGGAPASKLQLGIGFYGVGWTGVKNENNGLNQAATGPAPGGVEPGMSEYKLLKKLDYQAFVSQEAKTAWIFNGETFWTFDTPETIAMKMAYVKEQGLGGAFSWALHYDDADGTLQKAMQKGIQ